MPRLPQVKENVRVPGSAVPRRALEEADAINAAAGGRARVLVRASGTEPVVRVLAEAESEEEARNLCGRIAHLVREDLVDGAGAR